MDCTVCLSDVQYAPMLGVVTNSEMAYMSSRKKWQELEDIGQRIREARERLGMTQEELAAHIGRTQDTISSYELGNRAIRITELPALAHILKVPVGYFFGQDDPDIEALDLVTELKSLTPDQQQKVVERWRYELDWWRKQVVVPSITVQEA